MSTSIWESLFKRKQELFSENELLYHYTSLDVFCKFVEPPRNDFYCTHFKALNDGAEMRTGIDFAVSFLQSRLGWTDYEGLFFKKVYCDSINLDDVKVPWVMSFSRQRDNLNQWIAYTDPKRGGVSIGVQRGNLWSAIDRFPGCYSRAVSQDGRKATNKGFDLGLMPCLYSVRDKKLIEDLVEEMLTPYLDVFKCIIRNGILQDRPTDWNVAISSILRFSSIIKDESFGSEQEERLVLLPLTISYADCEVLGGKPRWRTYISEVQQEGFMSETHRGLRGLIREVIISPQGDRQLLHTTVNVLLKKYGMNNFCKLEDSCSPYNGR